jgi:hypothetical protein
MISRYDLNGDEQYIPAQEGFLFELKNNKLELVLNLNNNSLLPFDKGQWEGGLLRQYDNSAIEGEVVKIIAAVFRPKYYLSSKMIFVTTCVFFYNKFDYILWF